MRSRESLDQKAIADTESFLECLKTVKTSVNAPLQKKLKQRLARKVSTDTKEVK